MIPSIPKIRHINGYRVIYMPDHPKAMINKNWNGWIYEHIYIAEKYLGRPIREDEVVHHLDGFKDNNHYSNLLILPKQSHVKLHTWIDSNIPFGTRSRIPKYCKICNITLQDTQEYYCSVEHSNIDRERKRNCSVPSKDELIELLQNNSFVSVGKMFNVSDNAVRRWVKKFGLDPKSIRKYSCSVKIDEV